MPPCVPIPETSLSFSRLFVTGTLNSYHLLPVVPCKLLVAREDICVFNGLLWVLRNSSRQKRKTLLFFQCLIACHYS